jgi:hypothetical protein
VAFVALAAALWWRGRAASALVAVGLGGVLLLMGLTVPTTLGPVQRAWMGLGAAISRVTTPIFLGVVYFGAILPVGLVLRAAGRNPLTRHRAQATCWVTRSAGTRSRRDMQNQF